MNFIALSLASFATLTSASVPSLSPENFNSLTTGKSLFIKFYIPGCVYCKEMEGAWEKLAAKWEEHDYVFIGEVDCEERVNEELCEEINEFPTLKFGEVDEIIDLVELDVYDGGTDYKSLSDFAKENLKPSCSVSNIELCDDKNKNLINELQKMSVDDLHEVIDKVDENLDQVEIAIDDKFTALEKEYDELIDSLKDRILLVKKESYYKYMKEILALKKS